LFGRIILAKAKNRLDMPLILWKERDGVSLAFSFPPIEILISFIHMARVFGYFLDDNCMTKRVRTR
jgi:hypothetical protein